jgi:transcriptional regulator with XRE-family HTH domain
MAAKINEAQIEALKHAATIRKSKGLSLREVAKALGVKSDTTIMRYERGLISPPPNFLSEYAKLLELDPIELIRHRADSSSDDEAIAKQVLQTAYEEVVRPMASRKQRTNKPQKLNVVDSHLVSRSAVDFGSRDLIANAKSNGNINLWWSSRNCLPRLEHEVTMLQDSLDQAISKHCNLRMCLRLFGDATDKLPSINFILKNCIKLAVANSTSADSAFSILTLDTSGISRFPFDFTYAETKDGPKYVMAMASEEPYKTSCGIYSADGSEAVHKMFEFVMVNARRRIAIYTPDQFVGWLRTAVDIHGGDQFLMQPFFGWDTRPVTDFRDGSMWYKRLTAAWPADAANIALVKRDSYGAFRENLARKKSFFHIACYNTIARWAESGIREDVPSSQSRIDLNDSPLDRAKRIDSVIDLLNAHPSFNLALVDDFGKYASIEVANRDFSKSSWLVDGRSRIIAEISVPEERWPERWVKSAKNGFDRFGVLIDDQDMSRCAMKLFQRQWSLIPSRDKDRKSIVERLTAVKANIKR